VNAGDDPASPTYQLDALLFAFLHRDDSVAEYIKASRDAGVEFVTVTDRRVVLDWLSGKSGIEGPPGRIRPLAEEAGGVKRAAEDGAVGVVGGEGAGAEFGLPVAKKGRYQPDRADLDKLRQMMAIMDGPVYANILPSGIDNKGVKSGGIYRTRETVLRGDRLNVSRAVLPRHPGPSELRVPTNRG
jgi:parafibromin